MPAATAAPRHPRTVGPMTQDGGLADRLGTRARQRPEPRMWVAIAAVGCALAVAGLFVISGDAQAGDGDGDGSPVTGIVLSLLVVVAGYALMRLLREAPAASAGVTAVILGLPGLAFFLTVDIDDVPPFSLEAVLGLPALAWGISYVVGPGRGRPVLLGFALVFAWLFVLQVVEDPFEDLRPGSLFGGDVFGDPTVDDGFGDPGFDDDFGDPTFDEELGDPTFDEEVSQTEVVDAGPSASTIGWLSVVFGVGYLVAARALDRRGLAGAGTPFVVAGHAALIFGLLVLSDELGAAGIGVVLVVAGVVVSRLGAVSGRRVTTIIGAAEIGIGTVAVLGDALEDASATSVGTAFFLTGAAIAALAQVLHVTTREPDQTTPGPSSFRGWSGLGHQQVTAGATTGPATGGFVSGAPGGAPGAPPPGAGSPWAPPGPPSGGPWTPPAAPARPTPPAGPPVTPAPEAPPAAASDDPPFPPPPPPPPPLPT
jgi:hypothetical protein